MKHSAEQQQQYMTAALALAEAALETGDVPVGCVIVRGDQKRNACGGGQDRSGAGLFPAGIGVQSAAEGYPPFL